MDDIRIKFSLIGHPKLEKLKLIIGDQALERIITLWVRVAQNKPKGNLKGLDNMDIALYAGFKGDPDEFVKALQSCRWIKDNGNGFELQDWKEHQPWVYHAPERSEQARKAANIRWGSDDDTNSMPNACEQHAERNAPSPNPSPKPIPKPKPIKYSVNFLSFWNEYPVKKGKGAAYKSWQKQKPNIDIVLLAIKKQMEEKKKLRVNNQFCPGWPNPATWLNQLRWEDEDYEITEDDDGLTRFLHRHQNAE